MPNVLTDELGPIDLDQVAFLEIAERAVDLRHETGDSRLSCAGVAVEHEVLARCHFGQTVLATLLLNAQ